MRCGSEELNSPMGEDVMRYGNEDAEFYANLSAYGAFRFQKQNYLHHNQDIQNIH